MKLGSCFFGCLAATGLAVLVISAVGAVGLSVGQGTDLAATDTAGNVTPIGIGGAIALLVVVFASYWAGGYVAGRMARFSGAEPGPGRLVVGRRPHGRPDRHSSDRRHTRSAPSPRSESSWSAWSARSSAGSAACTVTARSTRPAQTRPDQTNSRSVTGVSGAGAAPNFFGQTMTPRTTDRSAAQLRISHRPFRIRTVKRQDPHWQAQLVRTEVEGRFPELYLAAIPGITARPDVPGPRSQPWAASEEQLASAPALMIWCVDRWQLAGPVPRE